MAGSRAAEEFAEVYRLTHERLLHEIDVPDETGEQGAKREEDANAVGPERASLGHRVSYEGRPKTHQDSGDDADNDAFLRNGGGDFFQAAVGLAIEDHG